MIISFLEELRKPPYECGPSAETLATKHSLSMGIGLSCRSKLAESLTGRLGYGIGYGKCHSGRCGGMKNSDLGL